MKFKLTLPDLTLEEAVELVESVGGGAVMWRDETGAGTTPDRPFKRLTAHPRHNEATIEPMAQ